MDFTNSILEESKQNDANKKLGLLKWNSNSTTPQNFVNDFEDHEYSHYSSIFGEVETRNYEIPKQSQPNQKNQQSMLFKKKLNNVTKRTSSYYSKILNIIRY